MKEGRRVLVTLISREDVMRALKETTQDADGPVVYQCPLYPQRLEFRSSFNAETCRAYSLGAPAKRSSNQDENVSYDPRCK